ncbi:Clustered mitochondria protein [Glycine soja]
MQITKWILHYGIGRQVGDKFGDGILQTLRVGFRADSAIVELNESTNLLGKGKASLGFEGQHYNNRIWNLQDMLITEWILHYGIGRQVGDKSSLKGETKDRMNKQLKKIEESFAQEWKVVDDLLGFSDLDDLRGLHDRVFSRYGLSPNSLVVVGAIVAVGVAMLGVAEHRRGHHSGTEIQNILRQRLEVGDREVDIEQCRNGWCPMVNFKQVKLQFERHNLSLHSSVTPRDANYTGPGSRFCILRPELITAYCQAQAAKALKSKEKNFQEVDNLATES